MATKVVKKLYCLWCKHEVEGEHAFGSACPHCRKAPLLLTEEPRQTE